MPVGRNRKQTLKPKIAKRQAAKKSSLRNKTTSSSEKEPKKNGEKFTVPKIAVLKKSVVKKDTWSYAKEAEMDSVVVKRVQAQTQEPPVAAEREEERELPSGYGDNMIYIMVRDPYWIYAYWEIQNDHQEQALKSLQGDWSTVKSVLRVYDITDKKPKWFDIELCNMADHWFLNVQPNRSYYVEIGLLHADGRYAVLARSNTITTPRAGMSDVIDERWMGIDFDKIYALSGGFGVGKSSQELTRMMEERLRLAISSGSGIGAITSGASERLVKKRGFWFVLDCELIVYGATEPDASVTMQGIPVKLRPDGTFTLRYALPDGKLVLKAQATSNDGIETRTITPIVERRTERPAPILREGGAQ